MSLPRRTQLARLLRPHGLRDVERMREDELKEVLGLLRTAEMSAGEGELPSNVGVVEGPPSSGALVMRSAEPPPPMVEDIDDPWALPRFREPRVFVPEGLSTFLRAIAVKPRLLFCTWDVAAAERDTLEGPVELQVFWSEFLGDAPDGRSVLQGTPMVRLPVDLAATGWYVTVPSDRIAVVLALVVASTGRRIVESNVSLAPPSRPAPPGPHWEATLPPSLDRRRLHERALFSGTVVPLRRVGEADARAVVASAVEVTLDEDLLETDDLEASPPASGSLVRSPRIQVRQARAGVPSSGALARRAAVAAGPAGRGPSDAGSAP